MESSIMLRTTNDYIEQLSNYAKSTELEFTDYKRICAENGARKMYQTAKSIGKDLSDFTIDNKMEILRQITFLELNASAIPNELFISPRNVKDKQGKWTAILEFGIEGAGNDVILQRYGKKVKEFKSYIVYKGDEFTPGYMDGWDMTLPKYKRTFKTNIPDKAVYLIKKENGEIDVQYADTGDVMKSLLAHIKNNMMNAINIDSKKLLRELSKLDLYEILTNEKWLDYELTKEGYNNKKYKTPLISPSYTSPSGMYNMIERKLRNHATRKYPKDFKRKEIATLYEKTFEDVDGLEEVERVETVDPKMVIDNTQKEVDEKASTEKLVVNGKEKETEEPKVDPRPKFEVDDDTGEILDQETPSNEVTEEQEEETEIDNSDDSEENWWEEA